MVTRRICASWVIAMLLGSSASAQGFSYPGFAGATGLAFAGSAAVVGSSLQLTPLSVNQAGAAWTSTRVPVAGGFDTTFQFRITPQSAGSGADGMAFVVQNSASGTTALGATGGSLGYQSLTQLPNSLVVELDVYPNGDFGETAGNVISVHTNGVGMNSAFESFSIGRVTPPVTMADGQPHQMRVELLPGVLNLYLDNLVSPLLSIPYDIVFGGTWISSGLLVGGLALTGGSAYVGFTGATGGLSEIHAIESWFYTPATVSLLTLAIAQPAGPGTVRIDVIGGAPGAPFFTALSVDPLNVSAPGQGFWGGLHISMTDLIAEVLFGGLPFLGTLDGAGASLFQLGSGLPPSLTLVHGVTRTFNPSFSQVTATSNLVSATLL